MYKSLVTLNAQRAALFARICKASAAVRMSLNSHNITRASRTANAQWNKPMNRAARRNVAFLEHNTGVRLF